MLLEDMVSRASLRTHARANAEIAYGKEPDRVMQNALHIYAFVFYCRILGLQECRVMSSEETIKIMRG